MLLYLLRLRFEIVNTSSTAPSIDETAKSKKPARER